MFLVQYFGINDQFIPEVFRWKLLKQLEMCLYDSSHNCKKSCKILRNMIVGILSKSKYVSFFNIFFEKMKEKSLRNQKILTKKITKILSITVI